MTVAKLRGLRRPVRPLLQPHCGGMALLRTNRADAQRRRALVLAGVAHIGVYVRRQIGKTDRAAHMPPGLDASRRLWMREMKTAVNYRLTGRATRMQSSHD